MISRKNTNSLLQIEIIKNSNKKKSNKKCTQKVKLEENPPLDYLELKTSVIKPPN